MHSAYSLLEGALTIPKLAALAGGGRRAGGGAHRHQQSVRRARILRKPSPRPGIQPIIGCTLSLDLRRRDETRAPQAASSSGPRRRPHRAARQGDERLRQSDAALDRAYLARPRRGEVVTSIADLAAHARGPDRAHRRPGRRRSTARSPKGSPELAESRLEALKAMFGDRLYVELQRHGLPQERGVEPLLLDLAYDLDLPLVATNEAYFATRGRLRGA